jgi:hypothetical protein
MSARGSLGDALLISVLPRLRPTGASALVALDPVSLELLAVRRFPPSEYLADPGSPKATPVEHCRGMAVWRGGLLVAMFNSVRNYRILDARKLVLAPGARFNHPGAVDLHGISVDGETLLAASTGADAVIAWPLGGGETHKIEISPQDTGDLRFPARRALETGYGDWRSVLPARFHINDVARLDDGSVVVCSLQRILRVQCGQLSTIHEDDQALLHDGRVLPDGRMLFSDAARGELLILDIDGTDVERVPVASPRTWFARGVTIHDGYALVLHSKKGRTHQRRPQRRRRSSAMRRPGCFGVSVVDMERRDIVRHRTIETDEVGDGAVAYSVLATTAI